VLVGFAVESVVGGGGTEVGPGISVGGMNMLITAGAGYAVADVDPGVWVGGGGTGVRVGREDGFFVGVGVSVGGISVGVGGSGVGSSVFVGVIVGVGRGLVVGRFVAAGVGVPVGFGGNMLICRMTMLSPTITGVSSPGNS
jgi:hypothetical protein